MYITQEEANKLKGDINMLAMYIKDKEKGFEKILNEHKFAIADLFMETKNFLRAYNIYKDVFLNDLERLCTDEKDLTAVIICAVKIYYCALQFADDLLEETETYIKTFIVQAKKLFDLEEYENILKENLIAYEELQDVTKLEIYKKLFLYQDGEGNREYVN